MIEEEHVEILDLANTVTAAALQTGLKNPKSLTKKGASKIIKKSKPLVPDSISPVMNGLDGADENGAESEAEILDGVDVRANLAGHNASPPNALNSTKLSHLIPVY